MDAHHALEETATSELARGAITQAKEVAVPVHVKTAIEWSTCGTSVNRLFV